MVLNLLSLDVKNYTVDKRELGKVMIVASFSLLVVSVHSAKLMGDAQQKLEKTNQEFGKTAAIINSSGFEESMQALRNLEGSDAPISSRFTQAVKAFGNAQQYIKLSREAQETLESGYILYRWLVLLSMLGLIAGISVIYV